MAPNPRLPIPPREHRHAVPSPALRVVERLVRGAEEGALKDFRHVVEVGEDTPEVVEASHATTPPLMVIGFKAAIRSRTWSARAAASLSPVPAKPSMNSSPPNRAERSREPTAALISSATSTRSWSPRACPASLKALKSSMLRKAIASFPSVAKARASCSDSQSCAERRFARRVSESRSVSRGSSLRTNWVKPPSPLRLDAHAELVARELAAQRLEAIQPRTR